MFSIDKSFCIAFDVILDLFIGSKYFVDVACSTYSLDDVINVLTNGPHIVSGLRSVDRVRNKFLVLIVEQVPLKQTLNIWSSQCL